MKKLKTISKGKKDYDFEEDTLFFKINDNDYDRSIELDNFVVDFDKKGNILGIQVFGASEIIGVSKEQLKDLKEWQIEAKINQT